MTFALLRVAAGPRLGHGHVRRALVLARALDRPCVLSLRGSGVSNVDLPIVVGGAAATLQAVRPRVLVVDDPHGPASAPWCSAARRLGVPVASMHDLGLAPVMSDLAVDGSIVTRGALPSARVLRGPAFAVIAAPRRRRRARHVRRILISLGGGPRAGLARRIAAALHAQWPQLDIAVTGGQGAATGFSWVTAPDGLAPWLSRVDAAVIGGGLSLYEAVAAGVPTVGVAVVAAQRPTVRGFATRGLTLDAGLAAPGPRIVASVARAMATLIADRAWRHDVATTGPQVVDGRGARRVARAILHLADGGGCA